MKRRVIKAIASVLFTMLFIFTAVLGADFEMGEVQADYNVPLTISFRNNYNPSQGKIQYSRDNKATWVDVTSNITSQSVTVTAENLYLRAVPENGYSVDFTGMGFSRGSAPLAALTQEQQTALTGAGLELSGVSHVTLSDVEFRQTGGGGNTSGKYNVHINQNAPGFTGKIDVQFFNGTTSLGNPERYEDNANNVDIPDNATKMVICFPPDAVSNHLTYFQNGNVRVNRSGTEYEYDAFDEMRNDANHVFTLDASKTYQYGRTTQGIDINKDTDCINLDFTFSNTRSVSWSYDPSAPADQYVSNCRLYFLGTTPDLNNISNSTDLQLTIGQDYYFLLVPDYGYQVASLRVNGIIDIVPQDSTGVFKFTMIDSNFHFRGVVAPSDDITDASMATAVSSVSIGNGANATANGGNLKVTVADAPAENVSSVASGTALATVDIDIDNIVSKGNGQYWTSDVTDITNPINVTLGLAGAAPGSFSVVRNHNGVLTNIPATYDAATNSITFPSTEFSTYTIVRTGDAVATAAAPTASPEMLAAAGDATKAGQMYLSKASGIEGSMIHPANGVTMLGISDITDPMAITLLTGEYNMIKSKMAGIATKSEKTIAFDLNATGKGTVTFDVGGSAPSAAIISHFMNGIWTRQVVDVINGQATGSFNGFSPIFITVYEGVTADQIRAAGITETESGVTAVGDGAKSPKTYDDELVICLMMIVLALVAASYIAIMFRKKA